MTNEEEERREVEMRGKKGGRRGVSKQTKEGRWKTEMETSSTAKGSRGEENEGRGSRGNEVHKDNMKSTRLPRNTAASGLVRLILDPAVL